MTRTTPPRPLAIETLFPELSAYRGTTTRLHPRPGNPDVSTSSVGGPFLWPADEPWPVCTENHDRGHGRRPADIHEERQVLDAAWARAPHSGPTEKDGQRLDELRREHYLPEIRETDPLPLIGVAQLYRGDIPDLAAGPDDCDLLQVFWCPFDAHGKTGYGMSLQLRWRKSWKVSEVMTSPPQPQVVGFDGYIPEPCVLCPEQVVTYPYAGLLPEELCNRICAWEEALEEEEEVEHFDTESRGETAGKPPAYQYDLSIPPGWRTGGYASWHVTDPYAMDCLACTTPMQLLLTIDSSEWDGGNRSWIPLEERDLPKRLGGSRPTKVTVGRWGELNIFSCPSNPQHPHRWSIQ